jgi:hypothetical protein
MKQVHRWNTAVAVTLLALVAASGPAAAQGPAKPTAAVKILLDNDKVVAGETTWAPGNENSMSARPPRVIRALAGGTLTVIYADGRTEQRVFETGGVYYFDRDAAPNRLKNEGATEVKVYFVFIK